MAETKQEQKIRLCSLALFEARLLSKLANPDQVKEVLRKYFGRRRDG